MLNGLRKLKDKLVTESPALMVMANLGAMGLTLLSAPIIARSLGPDGRGATAAAIAALTILPILLSLGVPLEVRRLAATGTGAEALRTARQLIVAAVVPSCLIAWVLTATIFHGLETAERVAILVSLAMTPVAMVWIADMNLLVALGRYRAVSAVRLAQPIVFVSVIAVGAVMDVITVTLVIWANLLGTAATTAVSLRLAAVSLRGPRVGRRPLLRSGLTFSGSAAAEAASNRLDQVLVLPLLGTSQSGLYSLAMMIGGLPIALAHAIGASSFRAIAAAPVDERQPMQRLAVQGASAVGFLACAALALVSPVLVPIIFGRDFAPAVPVTLLALVGSYAMVVAFVASMGLAADARGKRMTFAQVASLAIGLAGLFVLGPRFEALGAAGASSIAYGALLAILLVALRIDLLALIPSRNALKAGLGLILR